MTGKNEVISKEIFSQFSKNSYDHHDMGEKVEIAGVEYRVLDTVDHSHSGFEATAYLRDDGNVIIAYRGTEAVKLKFWDEPRKDLLADKDMVQHQVTAQQPDAEAFTQRVLAKVKEQHPAWNVNEHVFVTGHSLGGTHAEIEAARHHLGGAAFNAYGAVDLGYGVPERPAAHAPAFVGHARASDVVSSASRHYGALHVYAHEQDVASLKNGRYLDAPDPAHPANPLLAASVSAHFVNNFAPDDGGSSIMTAANEARYHQYQPAFDQYRHDVLTARVDLHDVLNHGHDPIQAARLEAQVNDALSVAAYGAGMRKAQKMAGVPAVERLFEEASHVARGTGQAMHGHANAVAQGVQFAGQVVQTGAGQSAHVLHVGGQASRQAGDAVSRQALGMVPVAPLMATGMALGAKGAGYVMQAEAEAFAHGVQLAGRVSHGAAEKVSQTVHGLGERTHDAFDAVSTRAHETSQSIHDMAQRLAGRQSHDAVQNTLIHGTQAAGAAIDHASRAVSQGVDAVERAAGQTHDGLTQPGSRLDHQSGAQATSGQPVDRSVRAPRPSSSVPSAEPVALGDIAHPQHALYARLKGAMPSETSEARLAQATAVCHRNNITAGNLGRIHIDDRAMSFSASWPPGRMAQADLKQPPPTPHESMQQIQVHGQQARQQVQTHASLNLQPDAPAMSAPGGR